MEITSQAIQRASVIASVELPVHDFCKNCLMQTFSDYHITNHFISSVYASLASAVALTPLDVLKTRLLNQQTSIKVEKPLPSHVFTRQADCSLQTFKNRVF